MSKLMWSTSIFMLPLFLILLSHSIIIFVNLPLMNVYSMEFPMTFIIDWTSVLFTFSVMFISSAVMLYSFKYIPNSEHPRFMMILILFVMSMIFLIFSGNLFFLMLGWDGLGITSYILVIFYQNAKSSESGMLTILSNRIGDILLLISISLLCFLGSWDFITDTDFPSPILIMISLAAMTKSAQFPFSAWLPAAMAAPTPISALVHSSTLVTAGVYLLIRLVTPSHPITAMIILSISSMTLFFSGISANWEQDLKKIIALSTLSQIAMMTFAFSMGAPIIAFFHLITHAFFKSTMFLCAGIMIHGSSYQDMRTQGAACNNYPSLLVILGICSMALMGLPFMSGFFSKDAIMETLLSSTANPFIMFISLFSIGLTATYSLRMSMLSSKWLTKKFKDNLFSLPLPMWLPIMILSPMSIFTGATLSWLIIPHQSYLMPFSMKSTIIIMIILGMTSGAILSFKSKSFQHTGESSISLWFLHTISCSPLLLLMKTSSITYFLDSTWTEIFSAKGSWSLLKKNSKYMTILSSSPLNILIMFSIPLLLMFHLFLLSLNKALYWS